MKKVLFLLVIVAASFIACEDKDDQGNTVIPKCTVITFDANGGIGSMADQSISENTSAALTANTFTRTGYTFAGWAVSSTGAKEYDDKADYRAGAGENSVTLYAQWTEILFTTVTFNANGGTGTMADQVIPENTSADLTANAFARAEYTFAGWNTQTDRSGTSYSDGASYTAGAGSNSVTLYAIWMAISGLSSNVTFDANGGSGEQTAPVTAISGQAMPTITAQAPVYEKYNTPEQFMPLISCNNTLNRKTQNICGGYEKRYFAGYFDAKNSGIKYYNADLSSARNWDKAEDTVLYAQWQTVWEKYNITGQTTDDFVAYFVDTPPTIDGNGNDQAWEKAQWQPICYQWMYQTSPFFPVTDAADFSGRFKMVWTADRLYILGELIDDIVSVSRLSTPTTSPEKDDCFELFIDEDASGGARSNNNNLFAYHISFYNANGNESGTHNVLDYVNGALPASQLRNHHLNYKIGRDDVNHKYTWEIEMKVYNSSYPVIEPATPPADNLVTLTDGKRMGFAAAYCDSDKDAHGESQTATNERNHFIGSMYVSGDNDEARDQGYRNASVYAKLYLVK
jgi:uncharacterized repeat protein (TIGR02543 family)